MDREDIIRMAREAGGQQDEVDMYFDYEQLERFANLVAAAVAEPVQEPVAWANSFDLQNFDMKVRTCPDLHHTVPLYTAPPKKEWVGLTDEEIAEIAATPAAIPGSYVHSFACAIEAKLREKNHG